MKAVQYPEHGNRDVMEYVDFPDPETDDVLGSVWAGEFEPRIRETLPASEAARTQRLREDREGFGEVVVVPDSEYDG
jgi:hypothetical protein